MAHKVKSKKTIKYASALEEALKSKEVIKIDLGCGANKQPGFIGIDIRKLPGVDIVHDIETYPWPLPSDCASLVMASHIVEHINPHKGNFIKFMNEAWRVLKYEGQMMIVTPYAGSIGYYSDPTHVNPCTHFTWRYFDPMYPDTYGVYRPLPWKIQNCFFRQDGNMEVLLVKRRIDKSYGTEVLDAY